MGAKKFCTRMIGLLLPLALCGCGGADSDNDLTLELRSDFLSREAISGTMDLTADYGQRVYEYTVEFSGTQKDGRMMYLSSSSAGGNTRTNAVISVVEDRSRPP